MSAKQPPEFYVSALRIYVDSSQSKSYKVCSNVIIFVLTISWMFAILSPEMQHIRSETPFLGSQWWRKDAVSDSVVERAYSHTKVFARITPWGSNGNWLMWKMANRQVRARACMCAFKRYLCFHFSSTCFTYCSWKVARWVSVDKHLTFCTGTETVQVTLLMWTLASSP